MVDEPDGFRDAFPFRVMMRYGENPALLPGAHAPDYERLWTGAFAGGMRSRTARARIAARAYHQAGTDARRKARSGGRVSPWLHLASNLAEPPLADPAANHVLVKSVQCARSIEWIVDTFEPRVVVIVRHPLNALASWRDLGFVRNPSENHDLARFARDQWDVKAPPLGAPLLAQQAFVFGVLTSALLAAVDRHPEWIVVRHEQLCTNPIVELQSLADRLGLMWTPSAEDFVLESDRRGEGFATARVASELVDGWRTRLDDAEVELIRGVLGAFPTAALTDC